MNFNQSLSQVSKSKLLYLRVMLILKHNTVFALLVLCVVAANVASMAFQRHTVSRKTSQSNGTNVAMNEMTKSSSSSITYVVVMSIVGLTVVLLLSCFAYIEGPSLLDELRRKLGR